MVLRDVNIEEYIESRASMNPNVELVRNPFIMVYLFNQQNVDINDTKGFKFDINLEDLIPINQDKLYNDKVSVANDFYAYSSRIREQSNIRYVLSTSELISKEYREKLLELGADEDDSFLVPFDYILITRRDHSQFMIAEDFSNTDLPHGIHRYTIIRYGGKNNPFRCSTIYSDGIDLSRLLTGDKKYIDIFSNYFLSEMRLNESVMPTYASLDKQGSDETDHGGGYVGYINAKTLTVGSTMEKNELLSFEKTINERSA